MSLLLLQHRENIYDLREYIHSNNIAHSIAHPLYQINRLTVNLFEKLLVLFNSFQGINGARNRRACDISNIILKIFQMNKSSNLLISIILNRLDQNHGIKDLLEVLMISVVYMLEERIQLLRKHIL